MNIIKFTRACGEMECFGEEVVVVRVRACDHCASSTPTHSDRAHEMYCAICSISTSILCAAHVVIYQLVVVFTQ